MGNKIITPSVQSTVLDEGGKILSDGFSKHEFNILLEDSINHTGFGILEFEEDLLYQRTFRFRRKRGKVLLESSSEISGGGIELEDAVGKVKPGFQYDVGGIQLEESISNFVQGAGEEIVLDRYREQSSNIFLIQEDGSKLHTEEFGFNLVLEDNDQFLLDDETADFIVLDGTNSSSLNAGEKLITESGIDFSNKDVTITDSVVQLEQLYLLILQVVQLQ